MPSPALVPHAPRLGLRAFRALVVCVALAPESAAQSGLLRPLDPLRPGAAVRLRYASPSDPGRPYVVGLSLPTATGTPLADGRVLPFALDALFFAALDPASPYFVGMGGALDALGEAEATMLLPADPSLVGLECAAGGVALDPSAPGGVARVSAPLRLKVLATTPAPDFSAVTARLQQAVAANELPGCTLAVVAEGTTLYQQSFGTFGPSTTVPIASATKWLSALVLMSAVEDGALALDTPLSALYPATANGPKASVTVRQMFSHTAGFGPNAPCLGAGGSTLQLCALSILAQPLVYPPGTAFLYGGVSMQLAGAAMEAALANFGAPETFYGRFQSRLKTPLGLPTLDFDSATNPRVAGGMIGGAADLPPVLSMLLALGRYGAVDVFRPSTVARMLQDETAALPILSSPGDVLAASGYGVGVWRTRLDPNDGAFEAASMGAFGSVFWVDFTRGYGAWLLTLDSGTADAASVYFDLRPLLEAALP